MHYHLAQVNVARMLGPLDSPVMASFAARLDEVNTLAEQSPGFVWRLQDATGIQPYDDPLVLVNLSVWESPAALKEYAYSGGHAEVFRARRQWMERPDKAHLAFWWIPAGHIPEVAEAVDRLDFRRKHGDTPAAFSFARLFPAPDAPTADPVPPRVDLNGRSFVTAANTSNGDADTRTRFEYRQHGARVWATYSGGRVRFGSLVAVGDREGRLDMRYQHVDSDGALRTGCCLSAPEVLPDGRVRLTEDWRWTNGDGSTGRSILEEVRRG